MFKVLSLPKRGKILKRFCIRAEFGVVAAAIQAHIDGKDQLSHTLSFRVDMAKLWIFRGNFKVAFPA